MSYEGSRLICKRCGESFSRPSSLRRHRKERRCPGRGSSAIVHAKPKAVPIRRQVIEVQPIRSKTQIVPAGPKPKPVEMPSGDGPPPWWEPQAEENWRRNIWAGFPAEYRHQLLAERAGAAFTIRPPDATDKVILWSQYHALKALATRLDAGIGTERERVAFDAGLREYDANYDRIRAQRKALPGGRP